MNKHPKLPPSFPALVQAYFGEYLTQQRALSPQTIAAYRDGFVLFLDFAEKRLGKAPAAMALADVTPELIMAFLDHLERQRHNSVRSRNARLAALRSFLKFCWPLGCGIAPGDRACLGSSGQAFRASDVRLPNP